MIRPVRLSDAARITEIYNHYVTDTVITFEETVITTEDYVDRISTVLAAGMPWLVEEIDGKVVGYAYATQWRKRVAYRFTVESAVYVDHQKLGTGTGSRLYTKLFDTLRENGIRSVMGLVALPNPESIKLHERFGFKKVGEHQEVGWKFERWIDVGVWQLMLQND